MKQDFIEVLKDVQKQSEAKDLSPVFQSLFEYISPGDLDQARMLFNKQIDHAIANYPSYKDEEHLCFEKSPPGTNINDKNFLVLTYDTHHHKNGEEALMLETKRTRGLVVDENKNLIERTKDNSIKKSSGTYKKSGITSFCVDRRGLNRYFTLVGRISPIGTKESIREIREIMSEKEFLDKIDDSPFINKPLFSPPHQKNGKWRITISAPEAISGEKIKFSSLTALLVGIKSLALSVQDIGKSGYIHQDFKLQNILLMLNGIIQTTDFGICIPKDEKDSRKINATAGRTPPELLASIIDKQRNILLKSNKLDEKSKETLRNSSQWPLTKQIAWINYYGLQIKKIPTNRYHFHCIQNLDKNDYSLKLWDYWRAQAPNLLEEIKLPSPQQDMWSSGMVMWDLLDAIDDKLLSPKEEKLLSDLRTLVNDRIIRATPKDRLTIGGFIGEFDKLLEGSPQLTEVNKKIEDYKEEFYKAQKTQSLAPVPTVAPEVKVVATTTQPKKPSPAPILEPVSITPPYAPTSIFDDVDPAVDYAALEDVELESDLVAPKKSSPDSTLELVPITPPSVSTSVFDDVEFGGKFKSDLRKKLIDLQGHLKLSQNYEFFFSRYKIGDVRVSKTAYTINKKIEEILHNYESHEVLELQEKIGDIVGIAQKGAKFSPSKGKCRFFCNMSKRTQQTANFHHSIARYLTSLDVPS
jgi:serine/threonine protein kinase